IVGTGILGGLVAWPLAILFLGESVGTLAFYAYVIPFLISTITGTIIAVGIINILKRNNRLTWLERSDRSNDRD
ncbi:MAG: energy coupling factor transporter S component ThiW, partial [Ruoffia tabacinasalis]